MPGVLMIEALAQVGAVAILSLPENKGKTAFFRFHQQRKIQTDGVAGRPSEAGVRNH